MSFAENTAHYQNVDGVDYFLLDDTYRAFELGNAPFAKDPFYAQFLVRVEGERAQRWYFSFSFMAHMGMGNTAFGNGPEANDIGVISESPRPSPTAGSTASAASTVTAPSWARCFSATTCRRACS